MPAIEREFPVAAARPTLRLVALVRRDCDALHGDVASGHVRKLLIESPSLYVAQERYSEGAGRAAVAATDRSRRGYGGDRRDDWNEETVTNVRSLATMLGRAGLRAKRFG